MKSKETDEDRVIWFLLVGQCEYSREDIRTHSCFRFEWAAVNLNEVSPKDRFASPLLRNWKWNWTWTIYYVPLYRTSTNLSGSAFDNCALLGLGLYSDNSSVLGPHRESEAGEYYNLITKGTVYDKMGASMRTRPVPSPLIFRSLPSPARHSSGHHWLFWMTICYCCLK